MRFIWGLRWAGYGSNRYALRVDRFSREPRNEGLLCEHPGPAPGQVRLRYTRAPSTVQYSTVWSSIAPGRATPMLFYILLW